MADEGEKEWDPEEETEAQRLAQENLRLGNKFLKDMTEEAEKRRAEEEKAKAEAEEYKKGLKGRLQALEGPPSPGIAAYSVPTFEEISEHMAKAWVEVKRIMSDAPANIQQDCFHSLVSSLYSASSAYKAPPVDG